MSVNWTTSAGKLASASSITNANGVATNTLTSAPQAGTATVEASAASGKSSTTVDFIADAPASGNKGISLQANPASITANGSSSTIIRASLQDEQGNPVGAGVMVNWHASAGALASAATNTDANGIASVVLTSAILAGPATIDASAGQAHNSTSVTFTPGAAAAGNSGLQLTLSSAAITADGTSSTTLSATVLDAHNNPVSAGTVVNWTTSAGTLASPSSVTNSSGIASVVLTSSTKAGSATLHATSGSANNATTVAFIPGAPAAGNQGLALTVTSAFASDTATLIATVQDSYGNPVGAGVAVTWATTAGALAGTTSLTDSSGIARMLLTATAVGQMATVNASAGAAYDSESVAFHAGVPAVGSNGISLAVGADDGSGTTALTASVRDAYGNAVGAGIAVNWTTSQGTLASATSITDANGMASMALTSTLGSTATVQATTGHAHDSINVVFMPGTPASGNNGISLAASPASLTADGTSTSTLTASVRDAKGNSVGAGVNVNWATNLGALSSATSSTDANGVATVVLTAATVPGTANVQATTGTASNQTNVRFIPGSPAAGSSGLSLTADPTSVPADGSSTTTLRATVRDNLGNPVAAGVAVSWTTSDGTLASATSVTDDNGVAQMLLTSSTQVGIAAVQAAAGAAGNALNVEFVNLTPVPAALTLTPSLTSLTANGASTSVLKAVVLDTKGKPMPAGTPVNWTTTAGSLASATSNTDASGVATVVLTSSVVAGQANVTATAGAASGAATVLY
ncbi:MAG: Ig-like domain-containing protein, partial [Pseudomonas sp.]|uniref:beta strand repeat-containing protein n=1 Tax=Pseudomonas sp. TaxID=306 RepID=UPI0030F265F2